jgi:hypothetical protein
MPRCPQCNKTLAELVRRCPSCMADLDLLVEYVNHLQAGLDEAEKLTRAGDLGGAVWAYLAVLEVDPDNAPARRQVGQVVTAVRQFDRAAPGRRWLSRMRQGLGADGETRLSAGWLRVGLAVLLLLAAFALGYALRSFSGLEETPPTHDKPRPPDPRRNTLGSLRAPCDPWKGFPS